MTLNELIEIVAPSGYEEPILAFCEKHAIRRGLHTERDRVGNLIVSNSATPRERSLAFYAHADQIGFVVNYITDDGFIHFKSVGGWDPAVLLGQRVVIINDKGESVPGVINRAATHLMDHDTQSAEIKIEDLWIDIGAEDRDMAEWLVAIGNVGTIAPQKTMEMRGMLVGQSFDDRIAIDILFSVLENARKLENTRVFLVINKAEEIGNFDAAAVAAAHIKADQAIAVDVTPATDQPGISKEKHGEVSLSEGPSIGTGGLVDRSISLKLKEIARKMDIPYQTEVITYSSGTDMDGVFRSGTPSGVVYIPCRYLHTPTETVSLADIGNTVLLLTEYCKDYDQTR